MGWWLRIRLVPAVCAGLVLCMALGAAADSITVPVPVVVGGISFPLPLPFLLPLVPVCILLQGQSRADTGLDSTAVRAVRIWDAAFTTLCAVAALLVGLVEAVATDQALGIGMARNFLGYLGIALLLQVLAGARVASAVVSLFPILCAAFGIRYGTPSVWAWPLHEPSSLSALTQAGILFAVGLTASAATTLAPAILPTRDPTP
ncbi:hypothetical protein ACFVT5_37840 [Streptomyces sp. NPDC058001]|uniref:hypothetical protein n=1 Tax=Streptomyces sp. NPDC058001 TaxID=3346300 RepID=UPI0036E21796